MDMRSPLVAWLCAMRALRQARAWLRHGNPDAIAAGALWRLNRHARWCKVANEDFTAYEIYHLKDLLLRAFWMRGMGRRVTAQTQVVACRGCDGTGVHGPPWNETTCWHCWGSGVYKRIPILRFEFEIAGRRYVWHAPRARCGWLDSLIIPDDPHPDYLGARTSAADRLTPEHVAVLLACCRWWLREDAGMLLRPSDDELGLPSLRLALRIYRETL